MLKLIQACSSFPNLETDMFFFWIILKGTRQAAFLTKLKFNGDFSLSFCKIYWMTELQPFSTFFFWRPSDFAALRVDRDEIGTLGSLMDKIGSRLSLFISIANSDLGPLASSNYRPLHNHFEQLGINLLQFIWNEWDQLAYLFGISEIRQRKPN